MKRNILQLFFGITQCPNGTTKKVTLLKPTLLTLFSLIGCNLFAQKDAIIKKDSTEIRCNILRENDTKYTYAFIDSNSKVVKASILKTFVIEVKYDKYDSNLVADRLFDPEPVVVTEEEVKSYKYTFAIGLNVSNVLEFNSPSGPDKKVFSATSALDLGLDYNKEGSRFAMTNELHWNLSLQKSGISSANHIEKVSDEFITLHDFSYSMTKNSKWNTNLIVKTNTSIFTVYDGSYFKDYNNLGKIQGFLSPYDIILSPGIKYQPNAYFRFSFAPYSVNLYGLTSQQIANTGFYTETFDSSGNYDKFVYKQQGAELNIWYDRKYKKWLDMQYRLGISSDYFSKTSIDVLFEGLFITKFKIYKNISLSHRASLKGDFTDSPLKPYYKQTILLGYSKSF